MKTFSSFCLFVFTFSMIYLHKKLYIDKNTHKIGNSLQNNQLQIQLCK